jgi:hypothetical protein
MKKKPMKQAHFGDIDNECVYHHEIKQTGRA